MDRRACQIALFCATLATLLLALYLRRYERELSGGERVPVLALRKSLARGELLSDDALAVREIPMAYLEARAVRASERSKVIGLPVGVPLGPAQGLLWSDLAIGAQARDLSQLVQPGKRAVTVLARGGFDGRDHALIHPGDYVDVLVTLDDGDGRGGDRRGSRVLLQRVLVLAVGAQTVGVLESRPHASSNPLTLSLDIQQAQKLSLAIERGSISVVLRNPDDALILERPPRVSAAMLSGDGPPPEPPAPSAQPINLGDIR